MCCRRYRIDQTFRARRVVVVQDVRLDPQYLEHEEAENSPGRPNKGILERIMYERQHCSSVR